MSNEFNYKGYSGSCVASIEDDCLHGRILFIDDLISYEGNSVSELGAAFKEAVDDYINYCEETGKPANKPYSGTFNVRIGPELHKSAVQCATLAGVKLNEFVRGALLNAVNLSCAQSEIKPQNGGLLNALSFNELEKPIPENEFHSPDTMVFISKPYGQSREVASAGSASLIGSEISELNVFSGINMKGHQLVTTH